MNYKYLEFSMVDTKSILEQIHTLQVLVTKLHELKIEISESFQAGCYHCKTAPKLERLQKETSSSKRLYVIGGIVETSVN